VKTHTNYYKTISYKIHAQDRHRTISNSAEKSGDLAEGAAKSAAIDPELAELLGRWKNLPPVIKSVVLAIARQHPTNNP
jgi:hypothetical protein